MEFFAACLTWWSVAAGAADPAAASPPFVTVPGVNIQQLSGPHPSQEVALAALPHCQSGDPPLLLQAPNLEGVQTLIQNLVSQGLLGR